MRIAAMAAGAVGGYFGARMAAAGHDVFFIARGANLEAIKKNGLKIESVHGDLHLPKPNVTDDPKSVGPVDIVLFAVKLWDTEKAAELTQPTGRARHPRHHLAERRRQRRAHRADPRRRSNHRRRHLHRHGDRRARRHQAHQHLRQDALRPRRQEARRRTLHAFVDAGKAAKLDIDLSADIERERWEKFVFLTAMAGSTATLRSPIGPIVADPEMRAFFRQLMEEAFAVGHAKGVALDHAFIDDRMAFVLNQGRARHEGLDGARPRTRQPAGTRLAQRQGARTRPRLGVPTPASDTVYTVLKLHRGSRRSQSMRLRLLRARHTDGQKQYNIDARDF